MGEEKRTSKKRGLLGNMTMWLILFAILIMLWGQIYAVVRINNYAKDDCFHKIEESAAQIAATVKYTMEQNEIELSMFADAVTASEFDSDNLLQLYMEQFLKRKVFSGIALVRADGSYVTAGDCAEISFSDLKVSEEIEKAPYLSGVIKDGKYRADQCIYQAVPIQREYTEVGVLYGVISLATLPSYLVYQDYAENPILFEAESGDFLSDEYHRYDQEGEELPLSNVYKTMVPRLTQKGYSWDTMLEQMRREEAGYLVFRSERTSQWYYSYWMSVGVKDWMIHITISEAEAFESYLKVKHTFEQFLALVVAGVALIVTALLNHGAENRRIHNQKLQTARERSTTDYLTGIGNRYGMYEFTQALKKEEPVGVIYCDVTGLKKTNDEQGHLAGDKLLNNAVDGMLMAFDKENLFRIGGDEFLILVTDLTEPQFEERMERMQEAWQSRGIVIAVGSEWIQKYSGDPESLSTRAEKRMYDAKREWYQQAGIDRRRSSAGSAPDEGVK